MILLDTCALIRLAEVPDHLPATAQRHVLANRGSLMVHAISAFEVAMLAARKRITLPAGQRDPARWYAEVLVHHGLTEIPLDGATAAAAVALPPIHADPCDRFIIATALARNLPIVTCDQTIPRYPGVTVLW